MTHKVINTSDAPEAVGPYSQGIKVGNLVYTSGQIGINPDTGKIISKDLIKQTKQAFKNLAAVLEASGSEITDVVKVTLFLTNMENFSKVNLIYGDFFQKPYPARSCVEVKGLPLGATIEIEAVAMASEK